MAIQQISQQLQQPLSSPVLPNGGLRTAVQLTPAQKMAIHQQRMIKAQRQQMNYSSASPGTRTNANLTPLQLQAFQRLIQQQKQQLSAQNSPQLMNALIQQQRMLANNNAKPKSPNDSKRTL